MNMLEQAVERIIGSERISIEAGDTLYKQEDFNEHGMNVEDLRTQINTGVRCLFIKHGCSICPKFTKAVTDVNLKLRRGEAISIVDIQRADPLIKYLDPSGTPELYLDGIVVSGATTKPGAQGFLEGFLEDALLIK